MSLTTEHPRVMISPSPNDRPARSAIMTPLPVQLLSQACAIYFDIAYPTGTATIPESRRPYQHIPADANLCDFLPPAPVAEGIVKLLTGTYPGYSLRLGCAAFPYLRLSFQNLTHRGESVWLCFVDTHDSWHHPDHPDAAAWLALQAANRELKTRIEKAFDAAGLLTHNRLLRQELQTG